MKRLHLFILKNFAGPFVFTLLITVFVLMMSGVWRYVDRIVGKDVPIPIILEFFGYIAVATLGMALPLATLLASIMTFGNMGEKYELIAIKAAGISLSRVLRPLIIVAFLLSGITFFVINHVAPVAHFKSKVLLSDIGQKNPEFLLEPGKFNNNIPGFTLRVGSVSKEKDGRFFDIIGYKNEGARETIIAKSGKMVITPSGKFLELTLYDGVRYEEDRRNKKSYPFTRTKFEELFNVFELESTELSRTESENTEDYRMLNLMQLDTIKRKKVVEFEGEKKDYQKQFYSQITRGEGSIRVDSTKIDAVLNADSLYALVGGNLESEILASALVRAKEVESAAERAVTRLGTYQQYLRMFDIKWHEKFMWPLACLIFFFVGSSLGAIIRKGGFGMPVLISIVLFVVYYMVSQFGQNSLVQKGLVPPYIGMWVSTALFLPLSVYLTYTAATDSSVMDSDAYKNFLKKLNPFRLFRKINKK